jgi:hypothetical protein
VPYHHQRRPSLGRGRRRRRRRRLRPACCQIIIVSIINAAVPYACARLSAFGLDKLTSIRIRVRWRGRARTYL